MWDTTSSIEFMPDYFEVTIEPPVEEASTTRVSSPLTLTLQSLILYNVTLTGVNCIGLTHNVIEIGILYIKGASIEGKGGFICFMIVQWC